MAWRDDVEAGETHGLVWTAQATDASWAGAGGPTAIDLAVISASVVSVLDRVPVVRATVVVSPPRDVDGTLLLRWLSPLHMTCQITLGATYTLDGVDHTTTVGTFQLRRRRLSWPIEGGVTLDCASWDGDAADRMSQADDIAGAFETEEG